MGVQTFSMAKDGQTKLSDNFKVHEFACKDGSDKILIDPMLVEALQAIRDHFGKTLTISSGFRTASYNSSIGGASNSQHLYGTAADFRVAGVNPRDIARWAEVNLWNLGRIGGLGLYDYAPGDKAGFVHVDARTTNRAQWIQTKSSSPTGYKVVGSITKDYLGEGVPVQPPATTQRTLKEGLSGKDVLEWILDLVDTGFMTEAAFDKLTTNSTKAMQKACGLAVDGVVGTKSRAAMVELLKLKSV